MSKTVKKSSRSLHIKASFLQKDIASHEEPLPTLNVVHNKSYLRCNIDIWPCCLPSYLDPIRQGRCGCLCPARSTVLWYMLVLSLGEVVHTGNIAPVEVDTLRRRAAGTYTFYERGTGGASRPGLVTVVMNPSGDP